ncbi:lipocalin family protein [Corynebacterium striatum]|uniref:lipocalin family protein n=1 Tax=Corynebacterium striatum TaxID=43770 RepID=UPI001F167583|nr:lipocalin family protein [Corynebacterium striatum]MDK8787797.1 lipocalin family protein [Corynebacterium striatum]MDK8831563.1 lipocalin family protein [Corynebacterium striatum]MDK8877532.1 lipocalin family protein [Corynebacterium striatum]MDK8882349.1 lipocalin family protein [Corynebacterium striatum]
MPQPAQLQCGSNSVANYSVIDARTISVDNSCRTYLGGRSGIHGTASVRSDASLRVNFSGIPFQNENGPVNYRVTYLAEDYSLTIIGDPDRLSGFVLSRTPLPNARAMGHRKVHRD